MCVHFLSFLNLGLGVSELQQHLGYSALLGALSLADIYITRKPIEK